MASLDLSPGVLDIAGVRAGDRNAIQITLTQGGAPLDLTGYTIAAQARTEPLAPGALNAVIEDRVDAQGQFLLRWPGDDVRTLLAGSDTWSGVWDLQILLTPEVDATTVLEGKFAAEQDVTRPGETTTFTATPIRPGVHHQRSAG
jgi:hypothetical protein